MGAANGGVSPELGVIGPHCCCFEDLHATVHDKATMAVRVGDKFEFQNKTQNSKI